MFKQMNIGFSEPK